MENSKGLQHLDDDSKKITRNLSDVEVITQAYLEKNNNGFERLVAKIFPDQIEKAKKAYVRDAFLKRASKDLTLYDVQTQYEVALLKEAMTLKLKEFRTAAEGAILKNFDNKAVDLFEELKPLESKLRKYFDDEYEEISQIKNEKLRKTNVESWERTIAAVFDSIAHCKERFANSVKQEITVYIQEANRK